jgi:hypothetical protein
VPGEHFRLKVRETFMQTFAAAELRFVVRNGVDAYGRRTFLRLNHNCDRHKRASALRDPVPFSPEDDSTKIAFFSLQGREIGREDVEGRIVKWFTIATLGAEVFLVMSTSTKRILVLDCCSCKVVKVLGETIIPNLIVAVNGESRRVAFVTSANPNRIVLARF